MDHGINVAEFSASPRANFLEQSLIDLTMHGAVRSYQRQQFALQAEPFGLVLLNLCPPQRTPRWASTER